MRSYFDQKDREGSTPVKVEIKEAAIKPIMAQKITFLLTLYFGLTKDKINQEKNIISAAAMKIIDLGPTKGKKQVSSMTKGIQKEIKTPNKMKTLQMFSTKPFSSLIKKSLNIFLII